MIETLTWGELSSNPDKYIKLAEEMEAEMQRDSYKLRKVLRYLRNLKKQKDIAESWETSGIPDQRQPKAPREQAEASAAGGPQPPPARCASCAS